MVIPHCAKLHTYLVSTTFGSSTMENTRDARKAREGWYEPNPTLLDDELQQNLDSVPDEIDGQTLPIKGARVIIAPYVVASTESPHSFPPSVSQF
jgi:hypothetical protein